MIVDKPSNLSFFDTISPIQIAYKVYSCQNKVLPTFLNHHQINLLFEYPYTLFPNESTLSEIQNTAIKFFNEHSTYHEFLIHHLKQN